MKAYKRTKRRHTRPADQHHGTTDRHGQPHKSNILETAQPAVQRKSLLRLQQGLAGLLRNRRRILMRYSKAMAEGRTDQALVLADLLAKTEASGHEVAQEIARRRLLPADPPKKRKGPRETKHHSKVRKIDPSTYKLD